MDMSAAYTCSPDVLAEEINGEMVLLDLSGEVYLGLNAVASRIWALLGEGCAPSVILDALESEFDAPRAQIEKDLQAFIGQLDEAGVIRASARHG